MDWIHCNDCYKQLYTSTKTLFLLTSCGRILCSDCNAKNSCLNRDCKPCRSQNYVAMPLDDSMPADVEDFFKDSLVHLKKFLKVYEFQRNNRERLSKYQNEKLKQMATQASKWQETTTDLQSQINKWKTEAQDLKLKVQQLENSLAKERSNNRPLVPNMYATNNKNETNDVTNKRNASTPSSDKAHGEPAISWQKKIPIPLNSVNSLASSRQQRYNPVHQNQLYQTRIKNFLDIDTPSFFQSYNNTATPNGATQLTSNNNARKPPLVFPTPVRIQRMCQPSDSAVHHLPKANAVPRQRQEDQQRRLTYDRVYAFMSEAARQAATPDSATSKQ